MFATPKMPPETHNTQMCSRLMLNTWARPQLLDPRLLPRSQILMHQWAWRRATQWSRDPRQFEGRNCEWPRWSETWRGRGRMYRRKLPERSARGAVLWEQTSQLI